jgi:hypothetical protein
MNVQKMNKNTVFQIRINENILKEYKSYCKQNNIVFAKRIRYLMKADYLKNNKDEKAKKK